MSTFVYAADPRVSPISETEVWLTESEQSLNTRWLVRYEGEVWNVYDQHERFYPESSLKETVEDAIGAAIGPPQISDLHAYAVRHAARMGGYLVGAGFSSDEEAVMDGLVAAGICEHIREPDRISYYRLTDTGKQVAETLGTPV